MVRKRAYSPYLFYFSDEGSRKGGGGGAFLPYSIGGGVIHLCSDPRRCFPSEEETGEKKPCCDGSRRKSGLGFAACRHTRTLIVSPKKIEPSLDIFSLIENALL